MPRPITITGDTAIVPLTRGYAAIIDVEDVPLVAGKNWTAAVFRNRKAVYAVRRAQEKYAAKAVLMHRILAKATIGSFVDHIDGNGLNNRKTNLRVCSKSQNGFNRPANANNKSGFKGVCWHAKDRKWVAQISVNRKYRRIGYYDTAVEAHHAYAAAAVELHGEFARVS